VPVSGESEGSPDTQLILGSKLLDPEALCIIRRLGSVPFSRRIVVEYVASTGKY